MIVHFWRWQDEANKRLWVPFFVQNALETFSFDKLFHALWRQEWCLVKWLQESNVSFDEFRVSNRFILNILTEWCLPFKKFVISLSSLGWFLHKWYNRCQLRWEMSSVIQCQCTRTLSSFASFVDCSHANTDQWQDFLSAIEFCNFTVSYACDTLR